MRVIKSVPTFVSRHVVPNCAMIRVPEVPGYWPPSLGTWRVWCIERDGLQKNPASTVVGVGAPCIFPVGQQRVTNQPLSPVRDLPPLPTGLALCTAHRR